MKKNKNKNKNVAPSRATYERNHPTFSFRINPELDKRLRVVKKETGRSNAEIMEIAVGLLEVQAANEKEIRTQALKEGENIGFGKAKNLPQRFTYLCRLCGEAIEITTPVDKEQAAKILSEHGWVHDECILKMKRPKSHTF